VRRFPEIGGLHYRYASLRVEPFEGKSGLSLLAPPLCFDQRDDDLLTTAT
jgi:hypothetical protein